jgi:tetrahydromethanopterin S-methyltransferase subunit G
MPRGRQRHPFLGLPTVAALPSQLVSPRVARDAIGLNGLVIGVLLFASTKDNKSTWRI